MKGTHGHHDVHREPEDRRRMVHPERDDVRESKERVREHRLDDESDDARVRLRRCMTESPLHAPGDGEDADTDERGTREVEDDDDRGVRERNECGGSSKEIGIGSARGVAGQDAKSGGGDVEDGGEYRDAPVAPDDGGAVDLGPHQLHQVSERHKTLTSRPSLIRFSTMEAALPSVWYHTAALSARNWPDPPG